MAGLTAALIADRETAPMGEGGRSHNLGLSVGIVAYEALRQNYDGFEKITIPNNRGLVL